MSNRLTNIFFAIKIRDGISGVEQQHLIDNHSRCLCNYIYRNLRTVSPISFKPARIAIGWSESPDLKANVYPSLGRPVAWKIDVRPRISEIKSLNFTKAESLLSRAIRKAKPGREPILSPAYIEPEVHEFFISHIEDAIPTIESELNIPRECFVKVIGNFRQGGYINRWIISSAKMPDTNCVGAIEGILSGFEMKKYIVFFESGVEVYRKILRESFPEEIFWMSGVNKISVVGKDFVIDSGVGAMYFSFEEVLKLIDENGAI